MAIKASGDNKFYTHTVNGLINATNQRKEIESNFDRSKIQLYEQVCKEQLKYAIELLKIGVDADFDESNVILELETGDVIKFSKEEIIEQVGEQTFRVLFPVEREDDWLDDDDDLLGYEEQPWPREEDDMRGYMKNMMMNPMNFFFPMFAQMMQPRQQPTITYGAPTSYGEDPLKAVQIQMDELRSSRDKVKKKAIIFKQQLEETKDKYEKAVRIAEEANQEATEKATQLLGEKEKLLEELDSLKAVIEEKEETLRNYESNHIAEKDQYDALMQEISEARLALESKASELAEKNSEIFEKQREVLERDTQIDSLRRSFEEQKAKYDEAVSNARELEQRIEALETANRNLQAQLKQKTDEAARASEKVQSLQQRVSSAEGNQNSANQKVNNLQNENNNLRNKNKDLESRNRDLEQKNRELQGAKTEAEQRIEELEAELAKYKEEHKVISVVAYKDSKFNVKNASGFHKDFYDSSIKSKILACVDVCDMKQINSEWSDDAGDRVIRYTIDALSERFGSENVYRMRGAQFCVIIDENSISAAKESLDKIRKLLNNKDFDVVYGACYIDENSKDASYTKAISEMRKMKQEKDNQGRNNIMLPNQAYGQPSMGLQPTQTTTFPMPQVQRVEMTEEVPVVTNPNVSKAVIDNAYPYSDDSMVTEVDATSIDLAKQIMDMAGNQ